MEAAKRYTLGAAIALQELPLISQWLIEGNRDIEIQNAVDPLFLDDKNAQTTTAREINELLDGHTGRRGIHGPFRGIMLNSPDPMAQEVVATRFKQGIEFAAMIGGTHMVVHSPFHSWMNPFSFNGTSAEMESSINNIKATLKTVLPVAEAHGVTLVLENIYDLNCYSIRNTMEAIDHPNLRMSLDIGHCELHVQQGGMPIDQYVREAGKWLEHLHIQDTDALRDRHWNIGEGRIAFKGLFEALREGEQNPRMILELKEKSGIIPSAEYLTNLGYGQ